MGGTALARRHGELAQLTPLSRVLGTFHYRTSQPGLRAGFANKLHEMSVALAWIVQTAASGAVTRCSYGLATLESPAARSQALLWRQGNAS